MGYFENPNIEVYPTVIDGIDVTQLEIKPSDIIVVKYHYNHSQTYTHIRYHQLQSLMFPLRPGFFGILPLKGIKLKDILRSYPHHTPPSIEAALIDWKVEFDNPHDDDIPFSMAPPGKQSQRFVDVSPGSEDCSEFYDSRYYSCLYQLTVPLTYFPKTTLPRIHNLCGKNGDNAVSILSRRLLSLTDMESRHQGKLGCLDNSGVSTVELEYRERLQPSLHNPKELEKLITNLKVREAHLQLMILLELVAASDLDEAQFLSTNAEVHAQYQKRQERASRKTLVRNKRKSVVPTFLGMGTSLAPVVAVETSDHYKWYLAMNALVDRLLLWDALDATSTSIQFLGYVVIPFFNGKLPNVVKHLVDKAKQSTIKAPKREKMPPKLTRSKSVPKQSDRPTLAKSLTSEPIPKLKRTSSNLTAKGLERRQVDFGIKRSKSVVAVEEPESSDSQALFGERKSKSVVVSEQQILATPMKKPAQSFASTPSDSSVLSKLLSVAETPTKNGKSMMMDSPIVINSPINIGSSPMKHHSPIKHSSPLKWSSPLKHSSPQKIHRTGHFQIPATPSRIPATPNITTTTTPGISIHSPQPSPSKRQPGKPIVIKSPFYNLEDLEK